MLRHLFTSQVHISTTGTLIFYAHNQLGPEIDKSIFHSHSRFIGQISIGFQLNWTINMTIYNMITPKHINLYKHYSIKKEWWNNSSIQLTYEKYWYPPLRQYCREDIHIELCPVHLLWHWRGCFKVVHFPWPTCTWTWQIHTPR